MKRKELYNFIREEIINELSLDEESVAWSSATKNKAKQQIDKSKLPGDAKKEAKDEIDQNPSGIISNVTEMARIASKIKLGDARKAELAMKVYKNSNVAKLLDLVKEAGEEGITQDELAQALGLTAASAINSDINLLVKAGALLKPKKEEPVTVEPTITTKPEAEKDEWESEDRDEADVEVEDEWEKSEEEESAPEEPSAAELAAAEREAKKVGGKGYAKELSPEEEEKYNKLKIGIDNKISKLLKVKKAKITTSDDYKILAQLIKRDDVKKLFKSKGIDLRAYVAGKLPI